THISLDDFRVVHANLTGGNRVTTGRQIPYCLFTDPELARIGLSETEAEAQGIAYRLFKVPMETNLRAHTLSETRGFVKALVEADSDRHSRVHGLRCRCGGDPGRRPDCDDRRAALHRAARCGPASPNTGRRSHISVLIPCVSAQRCRYKRSPDLRRIRCRAHLRRELRLELPKSTARRFAEGTTPVTGLDGIVVAMQSYYPSIPWRAPSLLSIPGPIRHQQRHRPTCFSCC